MATTGKNAWIKYFQGKGPVTTTTRGSKDVPLYDTDKKTVTMTIKSGEPIVVYEAKKYDEYSFGRSVVMMVKYKDKNYFLPFNNIAKPIKSSESFNMRAEMLIEKGNKTILEYGGEGVEGMCFDSFDLLKDSIVWGLQNKTNAPESLTDSVKDYLLSSDLSIFNWYGDLSDSDKNQAGKYLGEVFVGAVGLAGQAPKTMQPAVVKKNDVKSFCIPTDPSFAGVDSFFVLRDGSLLPISSKLGKGAAASFFRNLLPKAIKMHAKVPNGPLKDFITTVKKMGLSHEDFEKRNAPSMQTMYEYGVREVLGINKSTIKDPMEVFKDLSEAYKSRKPNNISAQTALVISKMSKYKPNSAPVLQNIPWSLSAFFARTIAGQIDKHPKTIDFLKAVLAGKDFYQANLLQTEWKKGTVKFAMTKSGKSNLTIIGSKSSTSDPSLKQGLINYVISYT